MIELRAISLRSGAFSLQNINLRVETGAYAVLTGRTGSGKTSLLEALCGLRTITAGQIILGARDVSRLHPSQRGIGYVPQDAALFRSMTVRENIAFALTIRKWNDLDINSRVDELGALLRIGHLLDRKVAALSGGEAQRVALGRALSFRPKILCMDEPLSALDDDTRLEMYDLLNEVRRHSKVTVLHVSHNKGDADHLADCVLQLKDSVVISATAAREELASSASFRIT